MCRCFDTAQYIIPKLLNLHQSTRRGGRVVNAYDSNDQDACNHIPSGAQVRILPTSFLFGNLI
ncbi:hypothetical protein HBH56_204050 [Parastagonospora nodorum]|uniref:Uncharacterized protein n=1 Tax=Phaeosphaeria nodorum (strain SN15 / ATCC MYA-4574 / FGSC 10173) TaxID=321614 RepID=A0A7U2FEU5_PHANO|nr:hypothetical protein HBH56_204050 [Parastagonospora nodorum]QRD01705.1 hypothetical protein JI435_417180 [Parastagonospora nodorum SN15]KAH3924004.1 hypothetical protein HBH54_202930 [Parastagonospora nodorum]KAH3959496.1 hypothetical protein HBH51_199140 [Parastagonospora nodorum]KAH4042789.1 hypothetical protein HBH49_242810 [Parastagonospora nodorum]